MSDFRSLTTNDNLIIQLSKIIQTTRTALMRSDMSASDAHEHIRDVETLLCHLMADMISSPMTGRLHLPNPEAYVDAATRRASLERQLSI